MTHKIIQYKGINRAVPQSLAPDGTCQEIINARLFRGTWRPIGVKQVVYAAELSAYTEIFIHDIESGKFEGIPNWIGYKSSLNSLYLIDPRDGSNTLITSGLGSDVSVVFLKRTMIVTSSNGVQVFLWNSDTDTYTETASLPVPNVDLSTGTSETKTTQCDDLDDYKTLASYALGKYFETLNTESQQNNRFYGSIMYMVAYRMFDGSFIKPSIPRYFQISNDVWIRFTNVHESGNRVNFNLTLKSLKASINADLYSSVGDTKDLIDSICVFATKVTPLHQIDEKTITETLLSKYIPSVKSYKSGTKDNDKYAKDILPVSEAFGKMLQSESWYLIHEFNFDEITEKKGNVTVDIDMKGYYQDYATNTTLTTDQFTHHTLAAKSAMVYNDRLHLLNVKTKLGDPYINWPDNTGEYANAGTTEGTITVWLKTALGKSVVTKVAQIPGYCPATETSEGPFLTYEQAEIFILTLTSEQQSTAKIEESWHYDDPLDSQNLTVDYYVHYKTLSSADGYVILPAIVGYNDSRAYKMQITVGGKMVFSESLQKNALMNFAYWHSKSFSADPAATDANYPITKRQLSAITVPVTSPDSIQLGYDTNRLQVSEIQNPLIFPAKNSYQIGTGDGITMAAGSEPLSTGQFGQFPLQVFTTKGIWALEIGSGDILYKNVVPVSTQVVENRLNVISVGNGVVYSTEKGLFMLNGRETIQLSDVVEGYPAIVSNIAEISTLLLTDETNTHFTPGLNQSTSAIDFLEYIKTSQIGFDYTNRELIVTNKDYHYSYVYCFDTKLWTKISQTFYKFVSNYPVTYGITSSSIINVSKESEEQDVQILIVTNAHSFEEPNVFKKIQRAIQRCKVGSDTGRVAGFYIFGSDDLVTWQLLVGKQKDGSYNQDLLCQWSHGSAKFFVFVFNGKVFPTSEINHIEILFNEKWNNRLR